MRTYYRKAWEVIGYVHDGAAFCLECAPPQWAEQSEISQENWVESRGYDSPQPRPVFVSDETDNMTCDTCHGLID